MPLVLALYLALPPRLRNGLLAAVSLVFYAWGAHALLLPFLAQHRRQLHRRPVDGRRVAISEITSGRRRIMWVAVGANLAALLFLEVHGVRGRRSCRRSAARWAGASVDSPSIALPIGISFFTFHGISYVVDVSRGPRPADAAASVDFALYMAFFPQLVAGPIVRYHEIDEQIRTPPPRSQRLDDIAEGFPRFALGLSKKVDHRRPAGAGRRRGLRLPAGSPSFAAAWLGVARLHGADLFRLLRLLRHGDRPGPDVRLPLPRELQPAYSRRLHHGLLAPLAHDAVALVSRLRLHPARRLARLAGADGPQPAWSCSS